MDTCPRVRYNSRAEARLALKQIKGRGGPYMKKLRAYRCQAECCSGGWHIGLLSKLVISGKQSRAEVYGR